MGLFAGSSREKKYQKRAKKYEDKSNKYREKLADKNVPYKYMQEQAAPPAQDLARKQREEDRLRGRQYSNEVMSRRYQGIDPAQRQSMEEGTNEAIDKQIRGYQRDLAGQQSQRGVRGGAAYAQRADLARMGTQAKGQYQRDVTSLDSDLALKKLAAAFNIEQGEASQGQLDRQMALDEKRMDEERRRQAIMERKAYKAFSRI